MATINVWQATVRTHARFRTSGGTACSSLSLRRDSGALSLRQATSLQYLRSAGPATRSRRPVVAAGAAASAGGEDEMGEAAEPKKNRPTPAEVHHRARIRRIKEATVKALKAMLLIKRQHDEGEEVTAQMLVSMQVLIGQAIFAVDSAMHKGTIKKSSAKKKKSKLTAAKQKLEIYLGCYDPDRPPKSREQKKLAAVMDARRPGHSPPSTTEPPPEL